MSTAKLTDDRDAHIDAVEDVDGAIHDSRAVWEVRETYGPSGLRGLVDSKFVAGVAAFSAMGGLLFGYDQGVVSVILVEEQFLQRFTRIADGAVSSGFWKGLLTAMIELGAFLGALNQGWIADRISRKYSIVVAVVIFIVGSALQTGAVDYAMLTVARFIGGIGIGMLSMVAPLYISEISPPEIRGTLLVLEEFAIVFGICVAYWITYGFRYVNSEWAWRGPFLIQIIPGIVLGLGVFLMPFSPRWLVSKGREQEAVDTLVRLRRVDKDDKRLRSEAWDIVAEVRLQKEVQRDRHPELFDNDRVISPFKLEVWSWVDLFRKNCIKRTHLGAGIMFFQQLVGINALIYYSPTLFQTMGVEYDTRLILAGVVNLTQLVGVMTSIYTMDRIGRKPLLLAGSAAMAVAHIVIAVLVGLYKNSWPTHRAEGWTAVGFLFFYMLSFGATWGPVPWAYPAEIFPSTLRAKGVAISTCSNWFFNFIIGLITPPLVQNTTYGAYLFFAIFCVLSFFWTYFFVKETKGRTLEQMDHVFQDNSRAEEVERRHRIERDIIVPTN